MTIPGMVFAKKWSATIFEHHPRDGKFVENGEMVQKNGHPVLQTCTSFAVIMDWEFLRRTSATGIGIGQIAGFI